MFKYDNKRNIFKKSLFLNSALSRCDFNPQYVIPWVIEVTARRCPRGAAACGTFPSILSCSVSSESGVPVAEPADAIPVQLQTHVSVKARALVSLESRLSGPIIGNNRWLRHNCMSSHFILNHCLARVYPGRNVSLVTPHRSAVMMSDCLREPRRRACHWWWHWAASVKRFIYLLPASSVRTRSC